MFPFKYFQSRIKEDLQKAKYVSFTADSWSSTDGAHSLLCITSHFIVESEQKFLLLAANPIKGRHNAQTIKELLNKSLDEFNLKEKCFLFVRDAAEVMVKACDDLGLRSIDCFAHKINLVS